MRNLSKLSAAVLACIMLVACGSNVKTSTKSTSNNNDIETPKKLAVQYYKDYFNKDFDKAFKNLDKSSLQLTGLTYEELVNKSKEQVFKSNGKLVDVLVKNSKTVDEGIVDVTCDLKFDINGKQQVVENQFLDFKYEGGDWYLIYKGILKTYTFSKVDYSDKTKLYIVPTKSFEAIHGIEVSFDIKNFTNVDYSLGWAGTDSYVVVETDKGTFRQLNGPMGKIKANEDDNVSVMFNEAKGKIKKITVTNIMPLRNGLPGFGDGNKSDIVVFEDKNGTGK